MGRSVIKANFLRKQFLNVKKCIHRQLYTRSILACMSTKGEGTDQTQLRTHAAMN